MNNSSVAAAEAALARLLDSLAATLLALDVTPTRMAQIARASFVKAGASGAKMRTSGRPHIARIAAITGLSRAEVKKIVSAQFRIAPHEPEHSPRALRVLAAWKSTNGYHRKGRPKTLRITGSAPSFEALCKHSSGDIPHKVILVELERRSLVRLTTKKNQVAISRAMPLSVGAPQSLATLSFAAAFLSALARSEDLLVCRQDRIRASKDIPLAYAQRSVSTRIEALSESLPALFVKKGQKTRTRDAVNIFTLVTRPDKESS